jgi:MFS family permease
MLISLNGVLVVAFEIALTLRLRRLAPVPLIAIGYAFTGIGMALTGIAHSLPALAITVVIWTFAEMVFAPMAGAYVTDLAPERHRGRYHGLQMLTWSIGMFLGPALGTAVYARSETLLWSACAAAGVVSAVLMTRTKREPVHATRPAT